MMGGGGGDGVAGHCGGDTAILTIPWGFTTEGGQKLDVSCAKQELTNWLEVFGKRFPPLLENAWGIIVFNGSTEEEGEDGEEEEGEEEGLLFPGWSLTDAARLLFGECNPKGGLKFFGAILFGETG